MNKEQKINVFSAIGTFIEQLSGFFDAKNHLNDNVLIKLALYERLIEKTGPTNTTAINKHLDAFNNWVLQNYNACLTQDLQKLNNEYKNITYSENVYVPLNDLLEKLNNEQKTEELVLMWKHILNISYKLTLDDNIKQSLLALYSKSKLETVNEETTQKISEEDMINNTIDNLKSELETLNVSNPKQAITELAKSGALERLIDNFTTNIESGNVDMGKMFNVVLGKLGSETGGQMNMSGLAPLMNLMGGLGSNNKNTENESIMFEEFQ